MCPTRQKDLVGSAGTYSDHCSEALLIDVPGAFIMALPDVVVCQRGPEPPHLHSRGAKLLHQLGWQYPKHLS